MPNIPPYDHYDQRRCCMSPLDQLEWMFKMQTAPSETAAIIIEPILGASWHTWCVLDRGPAVLSGCCQTAAVRTGAAQ